MSVGGQTAVVARGMRVTLPAARSLSLPGREPPGAVRVLAPNQTVLDRWVSDNVGRDRQLGIAAAKAALLDHAHSTIVGDWKVTIEVKATEGLGTYAGDRFLAPLAVSTDCSSTPCELTIRSSDIPSVLSYDGAAYPAPCRTRSPTATSSRVG